MLEKLFEVAPVEALVGCATLIGIAYLAAPEAGRRIATTKALPACVEGSEQAPATSRTGSEREIGAALLDHLAESLRGTDLGRGALGLAGALRGHGRNSAASPDRTAFCRCLVEATVRDGEVRRDVTIHLLTLRIVSESGVGDIGGHMARKRREGHCGGEANS
ncbi:MAG: hypothetical protein NW217_00190 [Hyphomicrobiaceae bacterium]|nr:hypothetical protein [Hyphomicrobiaceae bacterium]